MSYTTGVLATQADIVHTTGAVIEANHLGTPGLPASSDAAVTANGINFGTDTSHLERFSRSGSESARQFLSTDPTLHALLGGAYYQNDYGTNGQANYNFSLLNLGGLTQGNTYTLQFLISNTNNMTGASSMITLQGDSFSLGAWYPSWNQAAHYVRATFTADGATEQVRFGNYWGFESDRMQLNAYVLSEGTVATAPVPEPESYAMLLAGLATLGAITRRRKQA